MMSFVLFSIVIILIGSIYYFWIRTRFRNMIEECYTFVKPSSYYTSGFQKEDYIKDIKVVGDDLVSFGIKSGTVGKLYKAEREKDYSGMFGLFYSKKYYKFIIIRYLVPSTIDETIYKTNIPGEFFNREELKGVIIFDKR